jgi:hypothetical protein
MFDGWATGGEMSSDDGVEEDQQDQRQPEEEADDPQYVGLHQPGGHGDHIVNRETIQDFYLCLTVLLIKDTQR